jgi:hypothetical protein
MYTKINDIKIHYSFEQGVNVRIEGPDPLYLVELKEHLPGDDKPRQVEGYVITPTKFAYRNQFSYSQEFFGDFELFIYKINSNYGVTRIFSHRFDDRDKIVEFVLDTDAHQEAKLWAERVKVYSDLHGCRPVLKSKFPDINKKFPEYFKSDGLKRYKKYHIGRYPKNSNDFKTFQPQYEGLIWMGNWKLFWSYQHPRQWSTLTSQEIVDDILGL